MKFTLAAGLLSAASAVSLDQLENESLVQESAEMEQKCQDMNSIDESSLVQAE